MNMQLQRISERIIIFQLVLVLMILFYMQIYINSTKSESPHYDI